MYVYMILCVYNIHNIYICMYVPSKRLIAKRRILTIETCQKKVVTVIFNLHTSIVELESDFNIPM
jgi:hypothetical protein